MQNFEEIKKRAEALEKSGDLEWAIDALSAVLPDDSAIGSIKDDEKEGYSELYYLRGRLGWKAGHRGDAMSDYRRAISLNAQSPAVEALKLSGDIMNFYNKDFYNP